MTPDDVKYIKKLLSSGLIKSPCLELGVGYGGENNKELISNAGINYFGTDINSGICVDYLVDFEDEPEVIKKVFSDVDGFSSILVLNILEHTFAPIRVLDNVFNILRPGGTCIIITPTVWNLHNYPLDCWRINPNFYEEYCKRRNLELIYEYFEYLGFGQVKTHIDDCGNYRLPKPSKKESRRLLSRIFHEFFSTVGRNMLFTSHIAIGAVISK